jgi:hypothetical protein
VAGQTIRLVHRNGTTLIAGASTRLWAASRFSSPTVLSTDFPSGSPDYGPVTTGADGAAVFSDVAADSYRVSYDEAGKRRQWEPLQVNDLPDAVSAGGCWTDGTVSFPYGTTSVPGTGQFCLEMGLGVARPGAGTMAIIGNGHQLAEFRANPPGVPGDPESGNSLVLYNTQFNSDSVGLSPALDIWSYRTGSGTDVASEFEMTCIQETRGAIWDVVAIGGSYSDDAGLHNRSVGIKWQPQGNFTVQPTLNQVNTTHAFGYLAIPTVNSYNSTPRAFYNYHPVSIAGQTANLGTGAPAFLGFDEDNRRLMIYNPSTNAWDVFGATGSHAVP